MKFGKKYSNITVLMAMLHGIVIGVIALVIVGLFLLGAEGKRPIDQIENEIPASGPGNDKGNENSSEKSSEEGTFYAKQHGVFTTSTGAATFIEENPSLSTAAVMQVEDSYFVWSAVGRTEAEIEAILEEGTYKKAFSAALASCEIVQTEQLWKILNLNDLSEIKNSIVENEKEKEQVLAKKIDAITTFTDDLKVIRLHLFASFANEANCVKISF